MSDQLLNKPEDLGKIPEVLSKITEEENSFVDYQVDGAGFAYQTEISAEDSGEFVNFEDF
jgi:hypothetical protein